ncbi:unnamed protein product [Triticum turgidum subsp. durum]|uniref:Uncharacterized protein n=1 Tax=Triticum turgidum subsp. durum TaxID=4567 RepID=A0A9R0QA59_TRITD|nr:unnamed protein product [Triticum turgidum subsp. durum]
MWNTQEMVGCSRIPGVPRVSGMETSDKTDTVQTKGASHPTCIHSFTGIVSGLYLRGLLALIVVHTSEEELGVPMRCRGTCRWSSWSEAGVQARVERSPAALQQEDGGFVLRASMLTQATRLQQCGAGAWRRARGRWRRRRSSDDEAGQRSTRRRPHGLGEAAGNRFGPAGVEAEEQRKETRSARRQAWARRPAGRHGEEAAMRGAALGVEWSGSNSSLPRAGSQARDGGGRPTGMAAWASMVVQREEGEAEATMVPWGRSRREEEGGAVLLSLPL